MKLRKKRKLESIPVAAMGDIAFLLLIFYISTTMLTDQKPMEVDLPEITTEVQSSPYPLIVYMNQNLANQNKVYFFNQEIPVENLSDALTKKIYELPSSFRVYLNIDQSVSFKHMYKILQELKEAGIKNVIISTKPKESL
ncbi:MAG: biopolymer transporter ExbD [Leptospiraceae bacterium]|jgi:biopolymer transport protein ExbD|nr:biopolymer transporter ExbD [Leptospiraceae bacterium]